MIHLRKPVRLPVAAEVVRERSALRILCGVCSDADSVRRWVLVDPLVDSHVFYACGDCEDLTARAVAGICAESPRLLLTSAPVV